MLSLTAKKAIEFYGGMDIWKKSNFIQAIVSVTGFAFTLKRRPFFNNARIHMEIDRPFSKITPIGKDSDITGIIDGQNVRLEDQNGNIVSERKEARSYFGLGRRLFYWDDLDMAYFANYAFWNYFTLPRLLMNSEIIWTEKKEGILEAEFPNSIPTHSKFQSFHFDTATGKLLQHNYTADIISKLATAANVVHAHATQNGIVYPSSRIVSPRLPDGSALGKPVLINIQVHSFQLIV
jgi:hypothetical protein